MFQVCTCYQCQCSYKMRIVKSSSRKFEQTSLGHQVTCLGFMYSVHITQYDTQLGVLICTSISLVLSQNLKYCWWREVCTVSSQRVQAMQEKCFTCNCVLPGCIRNTSTVIAAEFCAQAEFMLPNWETAEPAVYLHSRPKRARHKIGHVQMHIIRLHLRYLQPLFEVQVQKGKMFVSTFVYYLVEVQNFDLKWYLVWVDAPVVDIEGPGVGHSPVVDVLHRVKDFHLGIIFVLFPTLDSHN